MKKQAFLVVLIAFAISCGAFGQKPEIIKNKTNSGEVMKNRITFNREGLTLVGNLFTPKNFDKNGKYKGIIVQGSATSVKEQMPEIYALKLANEGFVVLAFDYSHYGESEGKPRQLESPANKLMDLESAVSYLTNLRYVKSVGMVGVCTSGGNAAYLAADDSRIKAIATVAGFFPEPALIRSMFGEALFNSRLEASKEATRKYKANDEEAIVTAYSETDQTAANFSPQVGSFDYYLNEKRGNIPEYKNEISVMSYEQFYSFDPISKASAIKVPTMVVHSDGCAFPDQAKKFYSLLQGEKELVWGDGFHFDYYDQSKQVDFAIKNVTRFFNIHL